MSDYSVLFSRSDPDLTQVPEDCVVISPADPNWNDHGYGFQANAIVRKKGLGTLFECALFVIPRNTAFKRFNTWLEAQWGSDEQGSVVRPITDPFLSIFRSEKYYRELTKYCQSNHEEIGRVLRPMRDLVYFKWTRLESNALAEFLSTDRASKGVFRTDSTYLAWHRGPRILAGGSTLLIEDAKRDFSIRAALPGFSGPHILQLKFGVPEPLLDRCHALIGRNGSGKSQLLRELILQLGARSDSSGDAVFIDGERSTLIDVNLSPPDFLVNRVVAMSSDGESRFPTNSRLNSSFQYFSFGVNDSGPNETDYDPLDLNASETQTSQLIQLLRDDEFVGNEAPYEKLRRILLPALRVDRICVYLMPTKNEPAGNWIALEHLQYMPEGARLERFARIDVSQNPQRLDQHNDPVPLSSGERMFLNFGIRGAARLTQGSLLIMDEPETHLHPNLISSFMQVVAKLLEDTRSIAVIATHSPFVVRELPGRCVHIAELDEDRRPSINAAFLRTLGASIDQLSVDIFGDAESDQLNQTLAQKIARKGLTFAEIRELYGRDLSTDMLSEIHELMTYPENATSKKNE